MSIRIQKSTFYWALLGLTAHAFLSPSAKAASFDFGETAVETIDYLAENLKGRSVGTQKEAETVDYLVQQLEGFGYKPTLQPFSYE
ncbi:MAG: hypothetical protein AAGC54_06780, partial [Cyanobacteria bacterium P01_F01_bin.4]